MEKRKFYKLNIETGILGFGCMRFPLNEEGKIDRKEASNLLDVAIENGVNYIDTAYPYHNGESEEFVGEALEKYPRDSYYLATKLPVWFVKSIEDVDKIFQIQLDRLKTNYIDFYLMHAMNKSSWDEMVSLGVIEKLEKMKEEGKIRNLGFSFHDSYEVFEEIATYRAWDFCQIQLNYMDTKEQAGIKGYELTEKLEIPLIIMEPIKGGSLAKYSDDIEQLFKSHNKDASMASYALRWVAKFPNVKVILSGMSTMEQVKDNLDTFCNYKELTKEEEKTIEQVVSILENRVQNGCTGCRYCMPCPAQVDIPGNFSAWNTYHIYQNYDIVKWKWEQDLGDKKQAKNCIKCGKCETECPQKISIRKDLETLQRELDGKSI